RRPLRRLPRPPATPAAGQGGPSDHSPASATLVGSSFRESPTRCLRQPKAGSAPLEGTAETCATPAHGATESLAALTSFHLRSQRASATVERGAESCTPRHSREAVVRCGRLKGSR